MKKRITAISLGIALLAIAIVGASIAYFTDTDAETNVFTTGNVDITLIDDFTQNSKLLPGSQTMNAVPKKVSIKLEDGSEDAYVWYEWLIPAALDSTDGSTGTNNIVHVNSLGRTWDKYRENPNFWAEGQTEALPLDQTWDHDPDVELSLTGPQGFIGTETVDGVLYNKYLVLYHGMLSAGDETTVSMSQVYLDNKVDAYTNDDGDLVYTYNGADIDYDFTNGVKIIVRAYGMQAAGFADVYAAYSAY
ncbi:MAG: SipW-dependent-type signal peptide-containing protein [Bacillota bacterium]|nr:SipW-dependent-type signal peptide-containing protein [Bacillota bacterium]